MPKKANKVRKKTKGKIPPWGRPEKHIQKDLGLQSSSGDVPLGNNNPTMVQGKMFGSGGSGMNRPARGGLRTQRGRRGV